VWEVGRYIERTYEGIMVLVHQKDGGKIRGGGVFGGSRGRKTNGNLFSKSKKGLDAQKRNIRGK